ncbi:hypothetical protein B0H17DRAFT_1210900 [Mycena rosella]|uniref:Uncharacterized protein n=1 Tax=Mycena rosella TaxID=1033263 RepID=A0AAD7CZA0_MYCRO|nr:hypothetical protein B0H17DRAFT_1210900 [Mycena rosella]
MALNRKIHHLPSDSQCSPANSTFIVTFEAEEHLKTVVLDAEYKDLVVEAIKDLGLNQGFNVAADEVSKFNSV